MSMENIELIISLASACIAFMATAVTFLVKFIKAIKEKNLTHAKALFVQFAKQATEAAEAITSKDGTHLSPQNKLAYALNCFKALCAENNVEFDIDRAVGVIDEEIKHTKKVNSNVVCKEVNGVVVCEPVQKTEEVQSVKTPFQSF